MAYWSPRIRTLFPGLGLVAVLVLAGCEAAAVERSGSESDSLPFQVIREAAPLGDQPEQPYYAVVSEPEEWEAMSGSLPLEAITAGKQASGETEHLILVVYAGQQPSSGYSIAIEGIYPQEDVYLVRVDETRPGAEQITEPAFTLPYQIVAISRKELPIALNITFVFQDTQNKELARTTINTELPYPFP